MNCVHRPACSILSFLFICFAQAQFVASQNSLPPDVVNAIEKIDEKVVTETVKFLSSDAMAGRDTPSPELDIAIEFVAERFKSAGLIGGEVKNGEPSFFHSHRIATVALPGAKDVDFSVEGAAVKQFGLLGGSVDEIKFSGKVTVAGESNDRYEGPVLIDGGQIESVRGLSRRLRQMKQKGATCILIEIKSGHPLIASATKSQRARIVNTRGGAITIPTLLVTEFDTSKEVSLRIPPQKNGEAVVRNVIGMVRGSDPELSKEAVIFSAHLDHIGVTPGLEDSINNGADDNATGVTGVLSLADAFGSLKTPPKRTVIFMTFWGEERGLLGSRNYANRPSWPLEKTVANINLEMIGRPESGAHEKAWMTGWDQSDMGQIMAASSKRVGVLIFEHPQFSQMLYGSSDNASFVNKGVVAHSFSAGSLHDDYHQPGDEWEKIEFKHMTKVIQGLFVGSLPIVNGEATPKAAKKRSRR